MSADEFCSACDMARVIGLWCPGTVDGEPCNTVWFNLPGRENCPRCGDTLDYLRVDDPGVECQTCAEHHGFVVSEGPHSRACGWRAHEHGPACHRNCPTCAGVAPSKPRCPVGGMHMAKATEDACPACAADLPVQGEPQDD